MIQYPDLMKNLALGIFEMRIVFHTPGGVRVKRKLKRLIDLRHELPAVVGQSLPDPSLQTQDRHG